MFNYLFRDIQETKDLSSLTDFLMKQSLGYPKYEDWVVRAMGELEIGVKKAVLVYFNRTLVGDVIYQQHKTFPRIREIKNIRMHPSLRKRGCAQFALRQAELENQQNYDLLTVDTSEGKNSIHSFLTTMGYRKLGVAPLYGQNNEVIYVKGQKNSLLGKFESIF